MSLQTQRKKLFAPQTEALPVNVEGLDNAGFEFCILEGRPCIYAVSIYQHRDPSALMLGCSWYSRIVSSEEASRCTNQA